MHRAKKENEIKVINKAFSGYFETNLRKGHLKLLENNKLITSRKFTDDTYMVEDVESRERYLFDRY